MKKTVSFLFALIMVLTACQADSSNESTEENVIIYTSIYPIEFIVKQIAGDLANVKSIYPPGVDAHTYEPTSKEMTEIARGDAFIYIGAGLENISESIAESLANHDILFVEIGENENLFIENVHEEEHDHDQHHGDYDPHIWLDPLRMIEMAEMITTHLIELEPDSEKTFQHNLATLKEKLLELDEAFIDTLQHKGMKKMIVSHAAYGYWEERYGLEQIPISGLTSTDEPSQKELANIVRLAKEEQLQYVIFDQTGSNRLAEIIRENIGAEQLIIHNLEVLTEEDINNGEDYFSIMQKNLQTLDKATKE